MSSATILLSALKAKPLSKHWTSETLSPLKISLDQQWPCEFSRFDTFITEKTKNVKYCTKNFLAMYKKT